MSSATVIFRFPEVRSLPSKLMQACYIKYNDIFSADGVLLNANGGHTLRIRIKIITVFFEN